MFHDVIIEGVVTKITTSALKNGSNVVEYQLVNTTKTQGRNVTKVIDCKSFGRIAEIIPLLENKSIVGIGALNNNAFDYNGRSYNKCYVAINNIYEKIEVEHAMSPETTLNNQLNPVGT